MSKSIIYKGQKYTKVNDDDVRVLFMKVTNDATKLKNTAQKLINASTSKSCAEVKALALIDIPNHVKELHSHIQTLCNKI